MLKQNLFNDKRISFSLIHNSLFQFYPVVWIGLKKKTVQCFMKTHMMMHLTVYMFKPFPV